jgi:hypothetical protein
VLGRAAEALDWAVVFAAARVAAVFALVADFDSAVLSALADVSLDFAGSVVLDVAPLFGSAVDFDGVLVGDFGSFGSVDCAIRVEDDPEVEGIDEDDGFDAVDGVEAGGDVDDGGKVGDGAGIIVESRPVRSPAVDGTDGGGGVGTGEGLAAADCFGGGGECIMSRTYGTATAPTTPRTIRTRSARNHVAAKIDRGASSSYRSCSSRSSRSGLTGTSWLRDSAPCALS